MSLRGILTCGQPVIMIVPVSEHITAHVVKTGDQTLELYIENATKDPILIALVQYADDTDEYCLNLKRILAPEDDAIVIRDNVTSRNTLKPKPHRLCVATIQGMASPEEFITRFHRASIRIICGYAFKLPYYQWMPQFLQHLFLDFHRGNILLTIADQDELH